MRLHFSILFFISFSICAHAQKSCTEALQNHSFSVEIVEAMHFIHQSNLYEKERCPFNIHHLISNLKRANVSLEGAKVLFFAPLTQDPLTPYRSSYNTRNGWKFHVVLLVDGIVYDFDYTEEFKPEPINIYLREMFVLNEKMKKIKVISISASSYLTDFGEVNHQWFDYIRRPYRNLYEYYQNGDLEPLSEPNWRELVSSFLRNL